MVLLFVGTMLDHSKKLFFNIGWEMGYGKAIKANGVLRGVGVGYSLSSLYGGCRCHRTP